MAIVHLEGKFEKSGMFNDVAFDFSKACPLNKDLSSKQHTKGSELCQWEMSETFENCIPKTNSRKYLEVRVREGTRKSEGILQARDGNT